MFLPYISFILAFRALECNKSIGTPYVKSRDSRSDLPPYGSNWGHKIADFVFLPYISFILAFKALESIQRYWDTICEESRELVRFTPDPPLWVKLNKIADFVFLRPMSLHFCFYSFRMKLAL